MRFRGEMNFAGQTTKINVKGETQQIKLNFSYRFGNSQVKAAKQRNTGADDETKRAGSSGGGIGIGQ
jgi:hypothetical protein